MLKRQWSQQAFNLARVCLCACMLDDHGTLSGLSWDSGEQNSRQQLPQQGLRKKAHKTSIFSLCSSAWWHILPSFASEPPNRARGAVLPKMQSMHALRSYRDHDLDSEESSIIKQKAHSFGFHLRLSANVDWVWQSQDDHTEAIPVNFAPPEAFMLFPSSESSSQTLSGVQSDQAKRTR